MSLLTMTNPNQLCDVQNKGVRNTGPEKVWKTHATQIYNIFQAVLKLPQDN